MPRKKNVQDLTDICIQLIIKELSEIRSFSQLLHYREIRIQSLNETGQYISLPNEVIDNIYSSLESARHINEFNLELFIRKDMKKMLLKNNAPRIVYLIKSKLQRLETLEIYHRCGLTCNDMKELIANLPNLTKLSLALTIADNNVMDTILERCTKLKFLDISDTKILNMPFIKYTFQNNTVPLACRNLLYLDINGLDLVSRTYVTILKLFPYLEVLESDQILFILNLYSSQSNISYLNLKKIKIYELVRDQDLETIYNYCPHLQNLTLFCVVWNHERSRILLQCINLKNLNMWLISMSNDILNDFLRLCGSKIRTLQLWGCSVNVNHIAKFCPNIKGIYFYHSVLRYSFAESCFFYNFTNISELAFFSIDSNVETRTLIKSLLQFCCKTIKVLHLNFFLKNEDMKLIFQSDWRLLESLSFISVRDLDEDVLMIIILHSTMPLKKLCISQCPKITEPKIKILRQMVSNLNLELQIQYYVY